MGVGESKAVIDHFVSYQLKDESNIKLVMDNLRSIGLIASTAGGATEVFSSYFKEAYGKA
jgi:hypothetical protein